ncbi:papilin-like [Dendronephthya gigantea]|uniref:papilin-like n=1 Tax=Dendronephthya gigantea TaxID=151771 RepID=UPI00106B3BA7|nr:papilin-like [Dendronephthya gigantea]
MKLFYPILVIVLAVSETQSEWSESGKWSACSRSCGGGITSQERTCIGGNCVGESKTYRSCNIQDCPNGNGDFRKEQCAEYNSVPFENKTYEWVPYSGTFTDPCSLTCMPKNHFFFSTFKEKVVDGTRCYDRSYDMCVDGVCKKAGCDLILGSDAKEDKCRVCNGRGINCRTIKNIYKKRTTGLGAYVDILEIPTGATNILISEDTASGNYLALKTKDAYIFNGNRRIRGPYKYKAAGTAVDYRKNEGVESIHVLGPTSEALYLALLLRNEDVSISYEYSVPKSQQVVDSMIRYSWRVDEYGPCDKSCNGGTKTRKVYCVQDRDTAVEIDDEKCNADQKPAEEAACNVHHCPPRWFVGAWSPCSRSCGRGTQVRRVHCEKDTPSGIQMVNEKLCPGVKVITQRKCVELPECPKWKLGEWSQCSASCGGGTRSRSVQCMEINDNLISDDRCPEHNRPRNQEKCNETPCAVRWVTGEWGECRPSCGKGMRTRPVYCASSSQTARRYPDYICNQDNKPSIMKPCNNTENCPAMWYASMWSKCTANCGKGIQMRNVFCGVKRQPQTLTILSNERCRGLPQMKKIQQCVIKPCYTQWIALSWQPCSSSCGRGKRLRNVKCYADSEEDVTEKSCDLGTKPPAEDVCNLVDCPGGSNPTRVPTPQTLPVQTARPKRRPQGPLVNPTSTPRPQTPRRATRPQIITQRTQIVTTTQAPPVTRQPTQATRKVPGRLSTTLFPTRRTDNIDNDNDGIHGMSKPAEIIRGPENMEAVVGSDITMPCVATGNPKPEIFWLKGNLDVSVFGRRFQVGSDGTLSILQVQEVDEDSYTCVANNAISRRSQPSYLSVLTPPHVEITLGFTVKQGEPARIQCKVSGRPRPTVQWYKNSQPLRLQRTSRMTVTSREIYIRSTTLDDHGNYDCKATNKNGERIAHMMLDVMPDEQTRLNDLMNGNCRDMGKFIDCTMVGKIAGYCEKPYYQKVCCLTCRTKNNLGRRLEGI